MARHETKGAGMTERLVTIPETPAEQIAAFAAWSEAQPVAQPGELLGFARHRVNADRLRAVLATVGMEDRGKCAPDLSRLKELGLAENSAQWIAAHWLAEYNALLRACEKLGADDKSPDTLGRALMASEEMGRLQERLWWRAGVDPESGEKREALAIKGRRFRGAPKGERAATLAKRAFLIEVAASIGTDKREAIAAEAAANYRMRVRALWRAEGQNARSKILNFMRNNAL